MRTAFIGWTVALTLAISAHVVAAQATPDILPASQLTRQRLHVVLDSARVASHLPALAAAIVTTDSVVVWDASDFVTEVTLLDLLSHQSGCPADPSAGDCRPERPVPVGCGFGEGTPRDQSGGHQRGRSSGGGGDPQHASAIDGALSDREVVRVALPVDIEASRRT